MYLHQCYVTGTLKQCDNPVPVVRDVFIPWNPDSDTITVPTDSVAGSGEKVVVRLHDKSGNIAGSLWISFDTQIEYRIGWCTHYTLFPVTLPTATQKTWTFTYNYTEKRVVYVCNGVQVLNFVISDSACNNWSTLGEFYWSRKPTQIKFHYSDAASDSYCISSNTGNYNGCY